MSDVTIFIFGCGVMGVALVATLIASIAGDSANSSDSADFDRKREVGSSSIRRVKRNELPSV